MYSREKVAELSETDKSETSGAVLEDVANIQFIFVQY